MQGLTEWLGRRGSALAAALDHQREPICELVSIRLAKTYPSLCYDATRIDAESFQKLTFHEAPRRFHRVLQTLLRLAAIELIEREYRWGWGILPRYGVTAEHMLNQVRWYFASARSFVDLDAEDQEQFEALERAILQIIAHVTGAAGAPPNAGMNGGSHLLNAP